ncbi:hypothetical protein M1S95_22030, partial [Providencia rettgeri]|nr:hypothetical protein [Providencia rettgeri]
MEHHYGSAVAAQFISANAAIIAADDSDDDSESYSTRVEEITSLLDAVNKAGGVPDHRLVVERVSPNSTRVILNGPHGMVWRCYVFQDDFMFCFTRGLRANDAKNHANSVSSLFILKLIGTAFTATSVVMVGLRDGS